MKDAFFLELNERRVCLERSGEVFASSEVERSEDEFASRAGDQDSFPSVPYPVKPLT